MVLSRDATAGRDNDYHRWHQELVAIARTHEGLIEANLHDPIEGVQDQWIHVIRYDSVEHLRRFLEDEAYLRLLAESQNLVGGPVTQQIIAGVKPADAPVTVIVSQTVRQEHVPDYLKWQHEVDVAARKFPGFLGAEVVWPVPGVQSDWGVIYRFDSAQHLDDWFTSPTRQKLLKKAEPFFEKVHLRRVGRGFEDWFASMVPVGSRPPPRWKTSMIVLLALYPAVMLLQLLLWPLMEGWPIPYAMFLSNVLSVTVMSWPLLPLASRALGFWLDEESGSKRSTALLGTGLLLLLYAAMVALFAFVTGQGAIVSA